METEAKKLRVGWYRCLVSREDLSRLNQRSDFKGFLWTGGYLGLLALTGSAALYSVKHLPWYVAVLLFFFHGTCYAFLINGFHELVHDSVFKTRALNTFFLRIFSFLGLYNHHQFWASHTEHHKYTLHPPDDQEVILPVKLTMKNFYQSAVVNPWVLRWAWGTHFRYARGIMQGPWEHALFDNEPEKWRKLVNWSRIVIAGHAAIIIVSLIMHWWFLPLAITFAPCYGGWLHFLCNNSQHVGLKDNVPDFRLCCRTIYLNPFFRFLYWNMNYHTEHHMFAAVPCYNLGKLHKAIKAEMPYCPDGLYATWIQISTILKKQHEDPAYQYVPDLPPRPAGKEKDKGVDERIGAEEVAAAPAETTVPAETVAPG